MIAAPAGAYFVSQEYAGPSGTTHWSFPVAAFDDDGWPLIFADGEVRGRLLERPSGDKWTLNTYPTFPIASADGWFAIYELEDGGETRQPVAFWGFGEKSGATGFGDDAGLLTPMSEVSNLIGYRHQDDIPDTADSQATIERAKRNLAAASETFEQNIQDPEALASIQASLATIRQVLAVFGPPPPRP